MKKNNLYEFDFKVEIKDYTALCKNKKNSKYKTYLDWKKHIIEEIKDMNIQSLENFRHLCFYWEKAENRFKDIFLPLSIACISLYLTPLINPDKILWLTVIVYFLTVLLVSSLVSFSYFSYALTKDFYHDLAEIVQEYVDSFPEIEKNQLKAIRKIEVRK